MRAKEFISELNIDNRSGWGATPYNTDVDYFGFSVMMKPSIFLKLAAYLPVGDRERENIEKMKAHHKSGGAFGSPTLDIAVPNEWRDGDLSVLGTVIGHEGRHRMNAQMELNGDVPVETHIFLKSRNSEWRARVITPEVKQKINSGLYVEINK